MRFVGPYADILKIPGAASFSAAAFIARLPIAMVGLGIVLMVSAVRGSYAEAGAIAAVYTVSSALVSPLGSRAVDRWGQRRVVRILVVVHASALALLALLTTAAWPFAILLAVAVIAGATQPATGALVRARWANLLADDHRLGTAFAFESLLDELIFVVGPPLATILAAAVAAPAPVYAAALLVTVGSTLLVVQRRSEPEPVVAVEHADIRPLRRPGMPIVLFCLFAIGGVFGSVDVATVAAADAADARIAAGLILGGYAAGSMVAALYVGNRSTGRGSEYLPRLLAIAGLLLGLVSLPLALAPNLVVLGVVVFVAGLAVSPVLIACFTLVERLVPARQLTEGLTWAISAIGLGVAVAASLTGWWVDAIGSGTAFWLTTGAGAAVAIGALAGFPALRRGVSPPTGPDVR
ncbi:MAG: MFS transporter [Candidatus Nanopelagicales bacterium]